MSWLQTFEKPIRWYSYFHTHPLTKKITFNLEIHLSHLKWTISQCWLDHIQSSVNCNCNFTVPFTVKLCKVTINSGSGFGIGNNILKSNLFQCCTCVLEVKVICYMFYRWSVFGSSKRNQCYHIENSHHPVHINIHCFILVYTVPKKT